MRTIRFVGEILYLHNYTFFPFLQNCFFSNKSTSENTQGTSILAESRHKSFLWAALQILHCRCDFAGFHADFHDILSSSPSSSERRLKLPKKKFALKLVLLPWRQANLQDSWCFCSKPCFQLPHTPCSESELNGAIKPTRGTLRDEKSRGTSALVGYERFFSWEL